MNRKSPITPDILVRIKKELKMSDRDDIVFLACDGFRFISEGQPDCKTKV